MKKVIFSLLAGMFGLSVSGALPVAFTFDDGPKGNVTEVAPTLERHGWHGTFNIVVENVGKPGCLTWDDVRELKRRGHEIASHSLTHANLRKLDEEGRTNEVRREVFESRDVIRRELGAAPAFFCHPYIATTPAVEAVIAEAGMKPMTMRRHVMSHLSKPGNAHSAAALIRRELARGDKARPMDVIFHGTSPTSGGWEAMTGPDDFARMLDEVAELERDGKIRVVSYADYHAAYTAQ